MSINTSIPIDLHKYPQNFHTLNDEVKTRACHIKLLVLDVDGVMTDGGLYYDHSGLCMKRFHVLDGLGIQMAQEVEIMIAVISGSDISTVKKRLEYIGIKEYHGNIVNKYQQLKSILEQKKLHWNDVAYVGDDLVDLAVMTSVGLPIAVSNAVPEIKSIAKYITQRHGGCGAVRETIDLLLFCQGKKEELLHRWIHLK